MAEQKQTESDVTKHYNRVGDNEDGESYWPLATVGDPGFETFPGNPAGSSEDGGRAPNVDPFKLP